jgi:hypothetical protein
MNADKASGVFRVSLECLALHYGKIDIGRVAAIREFSVGVRRSKAVFLGHPVMPVVDGFVDSGIHHNSAESGSEVVLARVSR